MCCLGARHDIASATWLPSGQLMLPHRLHLVQTLATHDQTLNGCHLHCRWHQDLKQASGSMAYPTAIRGIDGIIDVGSMPPEFLKQLP